VRVEISQKNDFEMMRENEKKLFTLLDEFCDPNTQPSTKELHEIIFLLGNKQGEELESVDEWTTEWEEQCWNKNTDGFDDVNYERIFDRVKQQTKTDADKRLSLMQFLYRCAACLILPLIGLSAYLIVQVINVNYPVNTEIAEILDPLESQSRISLSDGSIVLLKDGSLLNQKSDFGGNTREVVLEGKAFFEIVHNPNKPFIIHTGRIRTTVLGTSFSITAIPGETSIAVAVAEGTVKIEDDERLLAILEASQLFTYGVELEPSQETVAEIVVDWSLHELIFRNMPFGDIVQELAVRYNANIVLRDEELKQRRISVLLDGRNSVEELLRLLSVSQGATLTIEGQTYVIRNAR